MNGRNTASVEVSIKDIYAKLYEALETVRLQQTALSSLSGRLRDVEMQLNAQKAQMTGLGPTVK